MSWNFYNFPYTFFIHFVCNHKHGVILVLLKQKLKVCEYNNPIWQKNELQEILPFRKFGRLEFFWYAWIFTNADLKFHFYQR